jgi:hypothetical protein
MEGRKREEEAQEQRSDSSKRLKNLPLNLFGHTRDHE